MRLLLASASPRRAELLTSSGFDFDVHVVTIDESRQDGEDAWHYVNRLAGEKAAAAVPHAGGRIIVAADTVVVADEQVLGKPRDASDAAHMLWLLSGRTHDVLTGVAVARDGRLLLHVERTAVRFATLTPSEIAWYLSTGEPYDKAGGYAIQGRAARFVESIDGSYSNVVGLPVAAVYDLLRKIEEDG